MRVVLGALCLEVASYLRGHQKAVAGVVDEGVRHDRCPVHFPETFAFVEFERPRVLLEDGQRAYVEGVRDLQPPIRLQYGVDGLVWFCRVWFYGIGTELSDHLPLPLGDYAIRVGEVALPTGIANRPDLDGRQPRILRGQGAPHVIHDTV